MRRPRLDKATLDAIAVSVEVAARAATEATRPDVEKAATWVRAMREWRGEPDHLEAFEQQEEPESALSPGWPGERADGWTWGGWYAFNNID